MTRGGPSTNASQLAQPNRWCAFGTHSDRGWFIRRVELRPAAQRTPRWPVVNSSAIIPGRPRPGPSETPKAGRGCRRPPERAVHRLQEAGGGEGGSPPNLTPARSGLNLWSLAPSAGEAFDCSAVAASFPYREVTGFKSPCCSRTFGQSVRLHSRHHSPLLAHFRHTSGHLSLGSVVNPRLPPTRSFLSLELSPFLETS